MNKKTLTAITLIFVSIVLFIGLYRPISDRVDALNQEFDNLNSKILEEENRLILFEQQKNQLDLASEVSINLLKNAIPTEMQQDMVIRDLISISQRNDIVLNSISFGRGGVGEGGVSVLRVNAGFEGGFNDLIRFLEGIEGNSRKFTINSISVQLASLTIGGVRRANFSLAMETYFINHN